jgi:mannose-1-phosphate guanylyltransferase
VGLLGTSRLIVVHTPDATLVCDRRRAHDLKRLVSRIRARGLARYL